jgi:hypothetical protein
MVITYEVDPVVDIIPKSMSNETNDDGEPSITVSPSNNDYICAGCTSTADPQNSDNIPFFYSLDGGSTWTLNACLPGGVSGMNPTESCSLDMSLRFGLNGLYVGYIRFDNYEMSVVNLADFTTQTLSTLETVSGGFVRDQPWVEVTTRKELVYIGGGIIGGIWLPYTFDAVLVGNNDLVAANGQTAAIDHYPTSPRPSSGFATTIIEARATEGQDAPSIRPAIASRTPAIHSLYFALSVYAGFFGWRTLNASGTYTSDVVVVRDDGGASTFTALKDSHGVAGVSVASGTTMPPFGSPLGSQRGGVDLALAVDPNVTASGNDTVYICWGDGASMGKSYTLHLRRSSQSGADGSWGTDLFTVTSAIHPALAVNARGDVGLFFQQLYNNGSENRWKNQLVIFVNGDFTSPETILLADVEDKGSLPDPPYVPDWSIGDYDNLIAVGSDFYGVFSGYNDPQTGTFPFGVQWQRIVVGNQLQDGQGNNVNPSVDPFFYHASPELIVKIIKENKEFDKFTAEGKGSYKAELPEKPIVENKLGDVKLDDGINPGYPGYIDPQILPTIAGRIDQIEESLATLRSFITESERPQVNAEALKKAGAKKKYTASAKKEGAEE